MVPLLPASAFYRYTWSVISKIQIISGYSSYCRDEISSLFCQLDLTKTRNSLLSFNNWTAETNVFVDRCLLPCCKIQIKANLLRETVLCLFVSSSLTIIIQTKSLRKKGQYAKENQKVETLSWPPCVEDLGKIWWCTVRWWRLDKISQSCNQIKSDLLMNLHSQTSSCKISSICP